MTIKFQYKHLKGVADFLLNQVSTKGKKNIHRMRVVNALNQQHNNYAKEELELIKEYADTDEQGELIPREGGGFKIAPSNAKVCNEAIQSLSGEYFTIDDSNLESALKTVEKLVNDFDKELVGHPAEMHYILSEAFENAKENEKGSEE